MLNQGMIMTEMGFLNSYKGRIHPQNTHLLPWTYALVKSLESGTRASSRSARCKSMHSLAT
jgi:hypothetical protein